MKNIVVIGGGTGSYTVLRGLKQYDVGLSAVVSMFDSGGSSGRLRDEFGYLPAGDARRALIALAEENGDNPLRRLFEHRFDNKTSSLDGHNVGNVIITALTDIYGSEAKAIEQAGKVLNIHGKVLPVSMTNTHLCAELENGEVVVGETNIDIPKHDGDLRIKKLYLQDKARIYGETRKVIENADLVIIGPGDLYSSIIPNLLVDGMAEALRKTKSVAYVCNLMTKWGETHGYNASDFVREVLRYAPGVTLDYVICNNKHGSNELLARYADERSYPVKVDEGIAGLAKKIVVNDLIQEPQLIRHDSSKLAKVIMDL